MIEYYTILNNIIDTNDQNILEKYVNGDGLLWESIENITGAFGGNMYTKSLPGNVLKYERIDPQIIKITERIQLNVCSELNLKYLKTYRCKINHTKPIDFNYDPLDLTHIDMKMDHLVIVYYINNSDGDTVILKNKDGISMENMFKHVDAVDKSAFTTLARIKPSKGSAVVFNGNLYHYGDFPKNGDRFVINIDLAVMSYKNLKNLL